MKGIVANCSTGEVKAIDDGLPAADPPIYSQSEGIDCQIVAEKLRELDQLKADVEDLKSSKSP